jgi:hypothetical protein
MELGRHHQEQADEIARLTAENERLHDLLETYERDAAFGLAQILRTGIDEVVADPMVAMGEIPGAVYAAIEKARQEEIRRLSGPAIRARVEEVLGEEQAAIDTEVDTRVETAAALALANFDSEEYRSRILGPRVRHAVARTVLGAKEQILQPEFGGDAPVAFATPETHEELLTRAKIIRTETRKTRILGYNHLREGDEMDVTFTTPGGAFRPASDVNSWQSPVTRMLTVRVLDTDTGAFEVVSDSWFDSQEQPGSAIRPGRQILLLGPNPDTVDHEPTNLLIKNQPVIIEPIGGLPVAEPKKPICVWFINLNGLKAMA